MMITRKDAKDIVVGVTFLLPNVLGFLAFTAIPLVVSLVLAFTDWNLEMHNYFRRDPITFVGFDNFVRLFSDPDFFRYLGNTLFMMIGIPFGMAGSLVAALLLNRDFSAGGHRRVRAVVLHTAILTSVCLMLVLLGMGATAMTLLIVGFFGAIWIGGTLGGQTVYRTLFYFPNFTAGVATFILWKKLYSPDNGPITLALQPILDGLSPFFAEFSATAGQGASALLALLAAGVFAWRMIHTLRRWREAEYGTGSTMLAFALLAAPLVFFGGWVPLEGAGVALAVVTGAMLLAMLAVFARGREHAIVWDGGLSDAAILGGAVTCVIFLLLGAAHVVHDLPAAAARGLVAPQWLTDYHWAKPSLIFMGLWAAFGSNNMLLYLAGLSGIPPELNEAADIDGASSWQRFWHVTWPQLANVTFFIFVMSVIGGLQGGFEMARTMTAGGPAGSTTTLSYFIFNEGFATGRLGYASAVAWTLFALVLVVTLFNWKFGNRHTND